MFSRVTQVTQPARSPMDLDQGMPTSKAALTTTGVTLLFIVISSLGALITYAFTPKASYEEWGVTNIIGAIFGALVACYCLIQAYTFGKLTNQGWLAYHRRLEEWHAASIEAYDRNHGLTTITQYNAFELSADKPHHVLLAAIAVHQQATAHERSTKGTPFSRRALEAGLYITAPNHTLKIGTLSGTQPERMANTLAQLGLVRGRGDRVAGTWVPETLDDVMHMIAANWHRLGRNDTQE